MAGAVVVSSLLRPVLLSRDARIHRGFGAKRARPDKSLNREANTTTSAPEKLKSAAIWVSAIAGPAGNAAVAKKSATVNPMDAVMSRSTSALTCSSLTTFEHATIDRLGFDGLSSCGVDGAIVNARPIVAFPAAAGSRLSGDTRHRYSQDAQRRRDRCVRGA